ncbi:MAG: long-chain fatty acid--CoA ligase [Bacteroidetes bacterium]|nr:long-chain fatty acid--CoA ligase [Bacteroidota bacterium]
MMLLKKIQDAPTFTILSSEHFELTNHAFCERVIDLAVEFRNQPKKVVAINMEQGIDAVVAMFAFAELSWVLAPFVGKENPSVYASFCWQNGEFKEQKAVVRESQLLTEFLNKNEAGLILSSSGTTGMPKNVLLNFSRLLNKYLRLKTPLKTVLVFPLSHISGIETLLSTISGLGTVIIPENSSTSKALNLINEHKAEFISCSPSYFKLLCFTGECHQKLRSLQFVNLAGEKTRKSDLDLFRERLPFIDFRQSFGTTETTIYRTYFTDGEGINIGEEGGAYKIIDGVLWLRSPYSMVGYLDVDEPAGEWFCTGDLVETTNKGQLVFKGRLSNVINVGGEKVNPAEIEEVLLQHPEVQEALVVGKDNSLLGQIPIAYLVAEKDIDLDKLKAYCRDNLAEYKVPFRFILKDGLELSNRLKKLKPS